MFFFLISMAFSDGPDWHRRYLRWTDKFEAIASPEEGYQLNTSMHKEIAPLVRAHPGIISPFIVGRTAMQKPIWGFRIRNPVVPPTQKVLVFAGLHALEWVGSEVSMALLKSLAVKPVRNVEVIIIPVVNVDRRLVAEADLLADRKKYRRSNAKGVDLNRDFEIKREAKAIWRHLLPDYYSTSPAPLSQPESRALDRLAEKERFQYTVSLHCFGGYIYYPWAGSYDRTEDHKEYHALGIMMEGAQRARHPYYAQQLSHWSFLFRAHGTELDHFHGKYGAKSFLIELTRSGLSFFDMESFKNPFRWYNPKNPAKDVQRGFDSVMALIRYAGQENSELDKNP